MTRRGIRALATIAVVAGTLTVTACSSAEPPWTPPEPGQDVGVQLFELPWTSIASECESSLGPEGFDFVLTSPPQEHVEGDQWWTSYQPVSYLVESKLGTRDEFADMVSRCRAAGVDVIADAVINHMTGQDAGGTGSAGSAFEHYDYPGLYSDADFHHCGLTSDDDIEDYSSREQVQQCELVNLADLDTGSDVVRGRIADYLKDLLSLGVAGFRIDAAKHMAEGDVQAIVDRLPEGTRILSEVIRGGASEPITPEEYVAAGEVFEFAYARKLGGEVASGHVNDPILSDERPGMVASDRAIVFIDNHDTERGEAVVTARDAALYVVANVLLLADDYGTPVVYSGYAFSDRDAGPPSEADGSVSDAVCDGVTEPVAQLADGERTCVHTWTSIAGMLAWRAVVADAPRLPGLSEGGAYGFERDGRGVVAVNPSDDPVTFVLPTTLPDGEYCDVVSGGASPAGDDGCAGATVAVTGGAATFDLAPVSAAGIHIEARP